MTDTDLPLGLPPHTLFASRILIVDDQEDNVVLLEDILEAAGYLRVESTTDPREVLGRYREQPFDLLLLDMIMPHLSGLEVMRALRQEGLPEYPNVLVLTADTTPEAKHQALAAGARDFLNKPFDVEEATLRIRNLLEMQALQRRLRDTNAQLETQVQERTRALAQSQAQYRAVLESIAEVVFELDGRGRIRFLNPAWRGLTGYGIEASLGTPLLRYLHPEDRLRLQPCLSALLSGARERCSFEGRYLTQAGEQRWLELTAKRSHPHTGSTGGLSGTLRDIHARRQAQEGLRHYQRALERSNSLKSNFLAMTSHEVRTPLTAIIGFAELLQEEVPGSLNNQQKLYVKDIYESGTQLLKLLSNILDISSYRSGTVELTLSSINVTTFIKSLLELVQSELDRKGLTLHLKLAPEVASLWADEAKLRQMLYNYLSNAVKFTPPGGSVTLSLEETDSEWRFEVRDTGIGIPKAQQEELFGLFHQVDNAFNRRYEGLGLGLAISKGLTELHGGRVWLESEEGKGSVFGLSIPRELS